MGWVLWLSVEERHLAWMRAMAEGASDRSRRAQHENVAKVCQNSYYHAMSSMNISLPDSLKAFVDEQVRSAAMARAASTCVS